MASILLIQDERPPARLLAWFLRDAGHIVVVAEDARALATDDGAPPDVVILNVDSESEQGRGAIEDIRQAAPSCPLIAITEGAQGLNGQHRPGDAGSDADAGAEPAPDRSLHLPFYSDAVLDAVDELTHAGTG
jgi:CheY-like chemotaxis protein